MEFKDYYAELGVKPDASQADIKRAYRKLARQFHPDVSKEPNAEARFKSVAEAHEVLHHAERRAAYDEAVAERKNGGSFKPFSSSAAPQGWNEGFDFGGADDASRSDFFEALFGRHRTEARRNAPRPAHDHHARVLIDLKDAYRGGLRSIDLRMPVTDASGRMAMQQRQLEVNIPKGMRAGQHLRLAGQGSDGGDLYLEIEFAPHPRFRVEDRDVYVDLPLAPWEAALGGLQTVATPDGSVQLNVPADSPAGRQLRLKGKGIPGNPPGDLYVRLTISLPPAVTAEAQEAYRLMASSFSDFKPRMQEEA